ncbi:hypothetical protein [Sporosarcina limicola]|uniref:Uncharacterized protein n=1 Tax=Sporosarcina limicola TaxID=34101 RepID=A0A927RD13_9BACL|nr:hypothetical protein [Sporosarcina limicola]MBE1553247.1 hypothetical protein [Sporosarcina limicola]
MKKLFERRSLMGFILKIIGLIIIFGGTVRTIIIISEVSPEFEGIMPVLNITILFTPVIVGALFIGFGEVIDLLQKIHDQNEPEMEMKELDSPTPTSFGTIPFESEQYLTEFYANKNEVIDMISPTKNCDIFIVKVDGRTEYVELGGFTPRILLEVEAEKY